MKHVCGECGVNFTSKRLKQIHQDLNAHFDPKSKKLKRFGSPRVISIQNEPGPKRYL